MIGFDYFFEKIKDVRFADICAVIPMTLARMMAPIYRKKHGETWLVCEAPFEARDNGYWFFKKMTENHPEQKCVYAIKQGSADRPKVTEVGEVVQYGSLKHWILYFACQCNISSQKGGKPNAALCAFMELNRWTKTFNVFLQHGVTINRVKWLYAERSAIDMFVTAAGPEHDFIINNFGYPEEAVVLAGFPRWDNLHQDRTENRRVVIMPTWRSWFKLKSKQKSGLETDFFHSEYLIRWRELLESPTMNNLIDKYDLEVIFFPHRNIQPYVKDMQADIRTRAIIASWEDYDIQELLITSAVMITDYSSVFFDMAYMGKPSVFYQFDLEEFRYGQYEEGYFDYEHNPFSVSCKTPDSVLRELEDILRGTSDVLRTLPIGRDVYFPYRDAYNSERIYQEIKKRVQ